MKVSTNNLEENMEVQAGPKLRNINDENEVLEEVSERADFRLKLCAAFLLILVVFVGIKGHFTKASLMSQIEEKQKALTTAQAEGLLYNITEDEDGDLIMPETKPETKSGDASELEWGSVEERNTEILNSFTNVLLNWSGKSEYDKNRQMLIDKWSFNEFNSQLLTAFMLDSNKLDEKQLNTLSTSAMALTGYDPYVLSNDGKTMSYFLICNVRNTIDGKFASGTVGIQITINEDGTLSNVTAQTLS